MSERFKLDTTDWKNIYHSALVWLIPLGLIYLLQIQAVLQANNITIKTEDFIPTTFTWGAITHYAVNRLYDAGKKFVAGK